MDWEKLRKNAAETIADLNNLDPDKMDAKQFMLFACATAVLDHKELDAVAVKECLTVQSGSLYADMGYAKLNDADRYWTHYTQSGEDVFRHIARQDLSHAAAILELVKKSDSESAGDIRNRLVAMEKYIK